MLPNNIYNLLKKYDEQRPVDNKDKSSLEILVSWGLCNVNHEQVRLTYKSVEQLRREKSEREKSIFNNILNFFR